MNTTYIHCNDITISEWNNMPAKITGDEIHIYYLTSDSIELDQDLLQLLPDEDLKKSKRFRHERDAKLFLAGRIWALKLLSFYNNIESNHIQIVKGKFNKPLVFDCAVLEVPCFNISHSGNALALAFARSLVGIDIEAIEPRDYSLLMADIYSCEEIACVKNSPNSLDTFYRIWTRKEAVLKANGAGLIDNLKDFSVSEKVNTTTVEELLSDLPYHVTTFKADALIGSVCVNGATPFQLKFFNAGALEI